MGEDAHATVARASCPCALASGLVFSYGPDTPHAIFADADRPPGKWYLDLAGDAVPGLLADAGLAPGSAGLVVEPSVARTLFALLIDASCRSGPESDALLAALARALLLALAHPGPEATPEAALAQATYQRCRAWLDAHAVAGVQEAATALALSPAYLSRLFQRFDRVTPGAHARRVRLQQAADRLVATGDRIQDVAAAAGYTDAFHFSRAFSRAFGMPPRAFRAWARPSGRGWT